MLIELALLAALTQSAGPKLVAEPWPQADALFQRDPRWIGGDAVYSIDLGHDQILWLFGDSFIATSPARSRHQAKMVRNCIAIQSGHDVTTASLNFSWKEPDGKPASFFDAPSPDSWYWPGHGARVGKRLILFLWEEKAAGGLGFSATGWQAIAIENPTADPKNWKTTKLKADSRFNILMGAAVLVQGNYLYAYAGGRERPDPTYLARWSLSAFSSNSPGQPEWFSGPAGWVPEANLKGEPTPIAEVGQSEFNIYPTHRLPPYLLIQTSGFGAATLAYQTAASLASGYSGKHDFYLPPEQNKPKVMIYSAKMHPALTAPGYDAVVSYSTNSFDFNNLLNDMTLYFPRFVRVRWIDKRK